METAPGIQLGIGPGSADTLKPPWLASSLVGMATSQLNQLRHGWQHNLQATSAES
jgi:hypothetical protein